MPRYLPLFASLLLAVCVVPSAQAGGDLDCHLAFQLEGWSAFYKTASGDGTVTCSDGTRLPVRITSRGGGLTFGISQVDDGRGEFTGIYRIHDVLGSYAAAEAHVGFMKARQVQVVTKGNVSLALSGSGSGWDIGVSVAKFTLSPR